MPDGAQRPMDYQAIQIECGKAASFADVACEKAIWRIMDRCRYHTMTSVERMFDLCNSVEYVHKARIPGAIVECGVWRGGSMMMAALMLQELGDTDRMLMLYDTFSGHPKPEASEEANLFGEKPGDLWQEGWGAVPVGEVLTNMEGTGYPKQRIQFIKGRVEETLPRTLDEQWAVALARLDTDWYPSTKVELEVLWPKLSLGGVLLIDDYGAMPGVRRAVDEYFADRPAKMTRIDYSGRTIIKC